MDGEVLLRVVALGLGLLAQLPCIGRRGPDDGGLVLLEHEEQAVAGDGTHPDGGGAQVLRADRVRAAHVEGEVKAVDVAVCGAHACLPEEARLGHLPQVEVLLSEGAHGRHAGGARGGGHEDDLLFGDRAQLAEEGAHALGVAFGLLVDEGELLDVCQGLEVVGAHAGLIEGALVVGRVLIGKAHHLLETLELQLLKLRARHALDFGVVVLLVVGDVLLCHRRLKPPWLLSDDEYALLNGNRGPNVPAAFL